MDSKEVFGRKRKRSLHRVEQTWAWEPGWSLEGLVIFDLDIFSSSFCLLGRDLNDRPGSLRSSALLSKACVPRT